MTTRPTTRRLGGFVLAAVLVPASLTACADDRPDRDGPPRGGHMGGTLTGRAGPALVASSEADYVASMIPHHEEAIASAGELARSDRPRMRALGRSIVASQTRQVALMRGWLARYHPDQPPASYTPMMRDLTRLRGDVLDRAFLSDMVVHHMAAVMMSQHALAAGLLRHPGVAALARRVVRTQRAEVVAMTRWSRAWFGGSPLGMGLRGGGPYPMRMMRPRR